MPITNIIKRTLRTRDGKAAEVTVTHATPPHVAAEEFRLFIARAESRTAAFETKASGPLPTRQEALDASEKVVVRLINAEGFAITQDLHADSAAAASVPYLRDPFTEAARRVALLRRIHLRMNPSAVPFPAIQNNNPQGGEA